VREEVKSVEPKDQDEGHEKQEAVPAANEKQDPEMDEKEPGLPRGIPFCYKILKKVFGPKQRVAELVVHVQSSNIKIEEPAPAQP